MSKYKDKLIEIAKYICSQEISMGIKDIRPICNPEVIVPSWKIPDFLSALYLSLFYFRANGDIYRICAYEKCGRIFKIEEGHRPRKYCCRTCTQYASNLRRRRKRKQEKTDQSTSSYENFRTDTNDI